MVKYATFVLQEAIGGSNPQRAASVLRKTADIVGCKGCGVLLIGDLEINAVETSKAAFG